MSENLDIILGTHNHLELTIDCIHALYTHTKIPFRLFVIDDSTDLTQQWIENWQKTHDNLHYIRPEEKLTCGNQVINIGLKNTESPIVCYINNSVVVDPEWCDVALPFIQRETKVGIVGFKLLKSSGVIEHAGIFFTPDMPHHLNFGTGEPAQHHTYIRDIGIVGFALVLIRRAAVPIGGFDEKTYIGFRGYDDLDNCLTMGQSGWKVVYCGLGSAYHYALSTRAEGDMEKLAMEAEENRIRFTNKWGNLKDRKDIIFTDNSFV